MKHKFCSLLVLFIFCVELLAVAASAKPAPWKGETPEGYAPITWAQAPGIASFYKAPSGNGSLDFITRIYLPQNLINPIFFGEADGSESARSSFVPDRPAEVPDPNIQQPVMRNFSYLRGGAETAKQISPEVKFLWDGPFFNMGNGLNDLSLALKYSEDGKEMVTSGTRSDADLAHARMMLLVDNATGRATVEPFNNVAFLDSSYDFAFEGFAATYGGGATGRLMLGVTPDGKELVVYCSRQATVKEASDALLNAGVPVKNQLQADGGGSASCGYNMPGQFFVEPSRTLPLMLGASTVAGRGTVAVDVLNVRQGPSTKNPVVTQITKGTNVVVFEEKGDWFRIGDSQWVYAPLVKMADIGK